MKTHTTMFSLALVAAACVGASCSGTPASPLQDGGGTDVGVPDAGAITTQFALRNDMRALWIDHVIWTRVFLIDAIAGLPDTPQATDRLLKNQVDIGNAIKPFYGPAAGDALTALLKVHIIGAAAVVTAAKAGDKVEFDKQNAAWYANGYDIATFLANANPNWPIADLRAHMNEHLDRTLAEASARLGSDWTGDVAAYDAVVMHILTMSDFLAEGIAKQFPDKVAIDTSMSASNADLHRAMRNLWEDHVGWTRVFLIDAIAGLPDTPQATQRLLKNQVDIGNAIKPFYGNDAGDKLASLLHDHITGAAALVAAAKAGDAYAVMQAKAAWYANADQIAAFLAAANPNWPLAALQSHMRLHLDETLAEATARLTSDWPGDIASYDAVVAHILVMADVLSDGIAKQIPSAL